MTGWCPIHDRVFEAKDGLCPKCGTALVADEEKPADHQEVVIMTEQEAVEPPAEPREAELGPQPRKRSPWIGIAAAILLAFVAGLAFPDPRLSRPRTIAPRDISVDLSVGVVRRQFDTSLRLESFTQHGTSVVARISVQEGTSIALGELRFVVVTFTLAGGGELPVEVSPRTTISGFIVEGPLLNRADVPVIGIKINELHFGSGVGSDVPIDISGAWPATARNQPRTVRTDTSIHPGDGRTIRVDGLVGWTDRMDVGITITGARPGYRYVTSYELVSDSIYEGSSGEEAISERERTSTVRFEDLPDRIGGRWRLRVAVDRIIAQGPWDWPLI